MYEELTQEFLKKEGLVFTQYAGILYSETGTETDCYKGWTLTELEYEREKHLVTALLGNYPRSRFITDRTESLRPFDIMLAAPDEPDVEQHLRIDRRMKRQYTILYASRSWLSRLIF